MNDATTRRLRLELACASVVLALAGAGATADAQQPTSAQAGAIRQACRSDYAANCAGVPTGGQAALACLQKNAAKTSRGMPAGVARRGRRGGPGRNCGSGIAGGRLRVGHGASVVEWARHAGCRRSLAAHDHRREGQRDDLPAAGRFVARAAHAQRARRDRRHARGRQGPDIRRGRRGVHHADRTRRTHGRADRTATRVRALPVARPGEGRGSGRQGPRGAREHGRQARAAGDAGDEPSSRRRSRRRSRSTTRRRGSSSARARQASSYSTASRCWRRSPAPRCRSR